jgi:filamentous hemagglutinin family protein
MYTPRSAISLSAILCGIFLAAPSAQAQQVRPDASVNTLVNTTNGLDFVITGGGTAGTNLFHSFSEFSVPTGGSAQFDNAATVRNIFSRVTGGSVSNIDGLIQANGSANLFLLNPNGILLGPNATLNIGGSFIGTTASAIKFADGTEFSATNPTPLLTMSVPIGLQFGSHPGQIAIAGEETQPTVLQLAPQQSFLLAGNDIQINNTGIIIPGGRIDLAGIAGSGVVDLLPIGQTYRLSVPTNITRGNVTLTGTEEGGSLLSTSGTPAGSVGITAQNFSNTRGWIFNRVNGVGLVGVPSGDIVIDALDTINLQSGWFTTRVNVGSVGTAGNITINTGTLLMQGGAQITASLSGTGQAGDITVNARDRVLIAGYDGYDNSSMLSSSLRNTGVGNAGTVTVNSPQVTIGQGGAIVGPSQSEGNGANIVVNTRELDLVDGGQIVTVTDRAGKAGNITINASSAITITGGDAAWINRDPQSANSVTPYSGIYVTAGLGSTGPGGNIQIATQDLQLRSGGRIDADTLGSGAAGTIVIKAANQVTVAGVNDFDGVNSGIAAAVFGGASGAGGNLSIEAAALRVADRGLITTGTTGSGNAGEIRINAGRTELISGGITSQSTGSGKAGTLDLTSNRLSLDQGATLSTASSNQGKAGNIVIRSGQLSLANGSQITSQSLGSGDGGMVEITAQTAALQNSTINAQTAAGNGGNLTFNLDQLLKLRDHSMLSASAGGGGNGGNLNITAPLLLGLENSDIVANAIQGRGGKIAITTQGIFGLKYRPTLTPNSDITASSEFGVNGSVQVNNIGVDPNSGLLEMPVDVVDPSQQIAAGCTGNQGGSFVVTGRGGIPVNPMQTVSADRAWQDLRATGADRSAMLSSAPLPITARAALIEATGWQRNAQGQPELIATAQRATGPQIVTCVPAISPKIGAP